MMRITCPQCGFFRELPDNKVPVTSTLATCPKCRHRFKFRYDKDAASRLEPRGHGPATVAEDGESSWRRPGKDAARRDVPPPPAAHWEPEDSLEEMPEDVVARPARPGDQAEDDPAPATQPPAPRTATERVLDKPAKSRLPLPDEAPKFRRDETARDQAPISRRGTLVPDPAPHDAPEASIGDRLDARQGRLLQERPEPSLEQAPRREQPSRQVAAPRAIAPPSAAPEVPEAPVAAAHPVEPVAPAVPVAPTVPDQDFTARQAPPPAPEEPAGSPEPTAAPRDQSPPPNAAPRDDASDTPGRRTDGVRDIWARLQAMNDEPRRKQAPAPKQIRQEDDPDDRDEPHEIITDPIPWERLDAYGFFPGLFLTLKKILLTPMEFFGAMPEGRPKGKALVFNLLISEFLLVIDFLWSLFGLRARIGDPGQADALHGIAHTPGLGFLIALLLVPIAISVGIYLDAWLTHLLLLLFRSAKKGFNETFRVMCYSAAPTVLSAVPVAGQILSPVILVWYMALQAIGLKKAHEGAYTQTLAAIFIKWSLYLFIILAMLQNLTPDR